MMNGTSAKKAGAKKSPFSLLYRFFYWLGEGTFYRPEAQTEEDRRPIDEEKRRRKGSVYPMSILFFAAVCGILFDRLASPGRLWLVILPLLTGVVLFFLLKGKPAIAKTGRKENFASFLSSNGPAILFLIWAASIFGLEHYFFEYRYAPDEIGYLIPAEGSPAVLEAWVDELPEVIPASPSAGRVIAAEDRTYFRAEAVRIQNGGRWEDISGRIIVSLPGNRSDLQIGDRLRLSAMAYHPAGKRNPGNWNQAEKLRRERILLNCSVNDAVSVQVEKQKEKFPVRRRIASIRTTVRERFQHSLSPENEPLASAMILGIRTGLDSEVRRLFQETGTAHLLAISGVHIGLVTGFFYLLCRVIGLPRRWTALGTAVVAVSYLLMTDLRAPAIRATILTLVLCGGILFQRKAFSINSLCLAALVILAVNPNQLFDIGAHLSFLATGVFFWLPNKISLFSIGYFQRMRFRLNQTAINRPIAGLLFRKCCSFVDSITYITAASFIIWLILLPLILNRLNILSAAAIFLNPFLWLPVTISLVSGFLLMTAGMLSDTLAVWSASAADFGFDMLRGLLETTQGFRYSHFFLPGPASWWCWIFYAALVLATLFPPIRPHRRLAVVLILAWAIIGITAGQVQRCADRFLGRLRVDVLSVGHGGASLMRFPDHRTVLYDCGTFGTPESAARTVFGALFARGGRKIDLVILSHADADHYNGLLPLMEQVKIGAVCVSPVMFEKKTAGITALSKKLAELEIPVYSVQAGDNLASIGYPELSILHPSVFAADGESNANSLVTALRYGGRGILFPGDLDSQQAEFLRNDPEKFEVILAPHHGGKSENERPLLEWAQPDTIIISGGTFQRNRASEEALRQAGYHVWNTFDSYATGIEILSRTADKRGKMRITPLALGQNGEYEIP